MEEQKVPVFDKVYYAMAPTIPSHYNHLLCQFLNANGATSVSSTAPSLTHFITNTLPSLDSIDSFDPKREGVYLVTPQWVERSLVLGEPQEPTYYSPDPSKLFSGVVATSEGLSQTDTEILSAGITALGGQWRTALTKEVTHLFTLGSGTLKYETALCYKDSMGMKVLVPHWFDDSVRLGFRGLKTEPYEWPDPKVFKNGWDGSAEQQEEEALQTPSIGTRVWKGKSLLLTSTLDLSRGQRLAHEADIEREGGEVLRWSTAGEEAEAATRADIIITRYRSGLSFVNGYKLQKIIGTLPWLWYVRSTGVMTRPEDQLLHYPIPRKPVEGFPNHVITITNYTGRDREYLKKLITTLGAEFTPSMSGRNTVLVAAYINGTKTTKARSWAIPIVNHLWLEDTFAQWRTASLSEAKYNYYQQNVDFSPLVASRGIKPIFDDSELEAMANEEATPAPDFNEAVENPAKSSSEGEGSVVPNGHPPLTGASSKEVEDAVMVDGDDDVDMAADVNFQDDDDAIVIDVDVQQKSTRKFGPPSKKVQSKKPQEASSPVTRLKGKGHAQVPSDNEDEVQAEKPRATKKRAPSLSPSRSKSPIPNPTTKRKAKPRIPSLSPSRSFTPPRKSKAKKTIAQLPPSSPLSSTPSSPLLGPSKKGKQRAVSPLPTVSKKTRKQVLEESDDEVEFVDEPVPSKKRGATTTAKNKKPSTSRPDDKKGKGTKAVPEAAEEEEEEEEEEPVRGRARGRPRGGGGRSVSRGRVDESSKRRTRSMSRARNALVEDGEDDSGAEGGRGKRKEEEEEAPLTRKKARNANRPTKKASEQVTRTPARSSKGKKVAPADSDIEMVDEEEELPKKVKSPVKTYTSSSKKAKVSARHVEDTDDENEETPEPIPPPKTSTSKTKKQDSASPQKRLARVGSVRGEGKEKATPSTRAKPIPTTTSSRKRRPTSEDGEEEADDSQDSPLPPPPPKKRGPPVTSASKSKPQEQSITKTPARKNAAKSHTPNVDSGLITPDRTSALKTPGTLQRTPSKRSAASKANQKLHDVIMPDMNLFQNQLKKGVVKGTWEGQVSGLHASGSGEHASKGRKRASMSNDGDGDVDMEGGEDEDDLREKKKRRLSSVASTAKGKKKAVVQEEDSDDDDGASVVSRRSSRSNIALSVKEPKAIKIMTTQVTLSDEVIRAMTKLGVKFTTKPSECTHLVAKSLVRTEKFLCAMAVAPIILTDKWVMACVSTKQILAEDDYLLNDPDNEKKFGFKLSEALDRARKNPGRLFAGITFYVTTKVPVDAKLLKNVVSSAGGLVLTTTPTVRILSNNKDRHVISCPEDVSIWRPISEAGYVVYSQELILTGMLRQQLDWESSANKVPGSY
ncbi:hypothetical protein ABKN59_011898 [Abortiporus biennis]